MYRKLIIGLFVAGVAVGALGAAGVSASTNARSAPAFVGIAPRQFTTDVANAVAIKATPDSQALYVLGPDGMLHSFGGPVATQHVALAHAPVALAVTRTGKGVWVFDADGCVVALGDARPFPQTICGKALNAPVIDAATTPDGGGYWLVAGDGGVFTFGDAGFYGSTGGMRLNAPVVGMAPTPGGTGYWEVAADGGVFSFNAGFLGSMGGSKLAAPVVGMVASGTGSLMVGSDGGVFNFGNPFFGSLANAPHGPITRAVPSFDGSGAPNGYWMMDNNGTVFALGAAWLPSAPNAPVPPPPVSNGCTVSITPNVLPGNGVETQIGIEVTTAQPETGTLQTVYPDHTDTTTIMTQAASPVSGASSGELVGVAGPTGEVVTLTATFPSTGATCSGSYVFQ